MALSWLIVTLDADREAFESAVRELAPPPSVVRAASSVAVTPPIKSIVVCRRTQTLVALENGVKRFSAICSTGRAGRETPPGMWRIREKRRFNRALPEYGGAPIPYTLRLDVVVGGRRRLIAIHSHPSVPRRPASNGCVRLKMADARRLFAWAKVGVVVTIR